MNYAPIALFVYNRLNHTKRTVEALKQNMLASESNLIIFSDAAKSEAGNEEVGKVRQYIRLIDGFKSVTIVERESNFGLAKSIIDGVTKTVKECGRIIVLEDDLVTSPFFLIYMNEALEKYSNDDRVISIHGYVYPVKDALPEVFFLPGADCWGWATWQRGWELFDGDGAYLLREINKKNLTYAFDYSGTYPLKKMLEDQVKGSNDSWAIRWFASAFIKGKLTLYPGRSLIQNIGNDSSGTHCDNSSHFDVILSGALIDLAGVEVKASQEAEIAFENYFRRHYPTGMRKIFRKISTILFGK